MMTTKTRVKNKVQVEMAAMIGSGVYMAYVYNRTGKVVVRAEDRKMATAR